MGKPACIKFGEILSLKLHNWKQALCSRWKRWCKWSNKLNWETYQHWRIRYKHFLSMAANSTLLDFLAKICCYFLRLELARYDYPWRNKRIIWKNWWRMDIRLKNRQTETGYRALYKLIKIKYRVKSKLHV